MGTKQLKPTRWLLLPVVMGIFLLNGCGLKGLFNGGSSTSPADATVTAIIKTATADTICNSGQIGTSTPQLHATLVLTTTNTSVTIGTYGRTQVTLVGTCWLPGRNVAFATLARGTNGGATVVPLTVATAPTQVGTPTPAPTNQPLKQTSNPDGTFTTSFILASDLAPYAVDNHLTLLAFADNYLQVAATTIQVS